MRWVDRVVQEAIYQWLWIMVVILVGSLDDESGLLPGVELSLIPLLFRAVGAVRSEFLSVELDQAASSSSVKSLYRCILLHVVQSFAHTVTSCDGSIVGLVQAEVTLGTSCD